MQTSYQNGSKFNRLTLLNRLPKQPGKAARGRFQCDCGTIKDAQLNAVVSGSTKSCGCLVREYYESGTVRSHGDHNSLEYKSWTQMKSRCFDPKNPSYGRYGGRGVGVCDWWQGKDGYAHFLADMGRRPTKDHSLDRWPDQDGDYEPGNCRWATRLEQQANRACARLLTYNGETMTMLQWANRLGMSWTSLANRAKRGLSDEQIITIPRRNYPR